MTHPLVKLAKKSYYFKSHIDVPLVMKKSISEDSNDFIVNANKLLCNVKDYPHAFVLACLMDSGVDANLAWSIPYRVADELGEFNIEALYEIPLSRFENMFNGDKKWHRYPNRSADFFYNCIHRIMEDDFIQGDASRIWMGRPKSIEVILRFLAFKGCGFKVANMAPNLLYRYYGVELSDYKSIDIAPDVHVMRVFTRLGLIPTVQDTEIKRIYVICKARELNPEFPGIIDGLCWEVGRNYCSPRNPKCNDCPLSGFCERKL